jgi:hypothetical protein
MLFGDSVGAAAEAGLLPEFAQLQDSRIFGHTPSLAAPSGVRPYKPSWKVPRRSMEGLQGIAVTFRPHTPPTLAPPAPHSMYARHTDRRSAIHGGLA